MSLSVAAMGLTAAAVLIGRPWRPTSLARVIVALALSVLAVVLAVAGLVGVAS